MQANYAGALGHGLHQHHVRPATCEGKSAKEIKQVAQELIFNGAAERVLARRADDVPRLQHPQRRAALPEDACRPSAPAAATCCAARTARRSPLEEVLRDETDANGNRADGAVRGRTPTAAAGCVLRELADAKQGQVATTPTCRRTWRRAASDRDLRRLRGGGPRILPAPCWTSGAKATRNGHVFEFPKCDFHVSDETFADPEQLAIFLKRLRAGQPQRLDLFHLRPRRGHAVRLLPPAHDDPGQPHAAASREHALLRLPERHHQHSAGSLPRRARRARRSSRACCDEIDKMMDLAVAGPPAEEARRSPR